MNTTQNTVSYFVPNFKIVRIKDGSGPIDYTYRQVQVLDTATALWLAAVCAMSTGLGVLAS